jgi:NADPH-dependent curcumin reductase CurA
VEASRNPRFAVGDAVAGMLGWQEYGLSDGRGLKKIDTSRIPLQAHLGVTGMPGVTAWYGLNRVCEPKPGETVLVSAAAGAVGSVVGQLAKAKGCRAVGIAGGPEKCAYVTSELGLDACIDHREHRDAGSMARAIRAVAPKGVDCLFENVGGVCLDGTLACMNPHGRIALCGLIAGYEGTPIPVHNVHVLLTMRLRLQGFIIGEHAEAWQPAVEELSAGVAEGRIKHRETMAQGLAAAPEAFIGMLQGRNFGKQLVKLA